MALQGSGPLSAEFEGFVVDTGTAERLPDIDSVTFPLHWTAEQSNEMPELSIARKIVLTWPGNFADHHLEYTSDLDSGDWHMMHATPVMMDGADHIMAHFWDQGMPSSVDKDRHGQDDRSVYGYADGHASVERF